MIRANLKYAGRWLVCYILIPPMLWFVLDISARVIVVVVSSAYSYVHYKAVEAEPDKAIILPEVVE